MIKVSRTVNSREKKGNQWVLMSFVQKNEFLALKK